MLVPLVLGFSLVVGACRSIPEPPAAQDDVMEWRQGVGNYGVESYVTLRGDLPNGYPTETWINDELLYRDENGDFEWNVVTAKPAVVALIDSQEDCESLSKIDKTWQEWPQEDTPAAGAVG